MKQHIIISDLITQATSAMEGDGIGESYIKQLTSTWNQLYEYL